MRRKEWRGEGGGGEGGDRASFDRCIRTYRPCKLYVLVLALCTALGV